MLTTYRGLDKRVSYGPVVVPSSQHSWYFLYIYVLSLLVHFQMKSLVCEAL